MKSNSIERKQVAYDSSLPIAKDATFRVDGSCMDSPLSPIRMKDGQQLSVHPFQGDFNAYADIEKVMGKVCVVQYLYLGNRYFTVKQIIGIDELADTLRLMFYYPEKTEVAVRIKAIERIYFVDGVV